MSLERADDLGPAIRQRLAGFMRTLRDNGFKVGLTESSDALRVLSASGIDRATKARPALKALLCGRRSDWEAFDILFDAYWSGRNVTNSEKH